MVSRSRVGGLVDADGGDRIDGVAEHSGLSEEVHHFCRLRPAVLGRLPNRHEARSRVHGLPVEGCVQPLRAFGFSQLDSDNSSQGQMYTLANTSGVIRSTFVVDEKGKIAVTQPTSRPLATSPNCAETRRSKPGMQSDRSPFQRG